MATAQQRPLHSGAAAGHNPLQRCGVMDQVTKKGGRADPFGTLNQNDFRMHTWDDVRHLLLRGKSCPAEDDNDNDDGDVDGGDITALVYSMNAVLRWMIS